MSIAKMCVAVGQNVCLVCIFLAAIHPGGEANSRNYDDPLSRTRAEVESLKERTVRNVQRPSSMEDRTNTSRKLHVSPKIIEGAISENSKFFMRKLFQKYGSGGLMTFEGFEHFLENLGLAHINIEDHNLSDHKDSGRFIDLHGGEHKHDVPTSTLPPVQDKGHSHGDHEHAHDSHGAGTQDHDSHAHDTHGHESHKRRKRDLTESNLDVFMSHSVNKIQKTSHRLAGTRNSKLGVSVKNSQSHKRSKRSLDQHDGHSHDDHDHSSHAGHDHAAHDDHDHSSHVGHDQTSPDGHNHDDHDHSSHDSRRAEGQKSPGRKRDDHLDLTTASTVPSDRARSSKRKSSRRRGRVQGRKNNRPTPQPLETSTPAPPTQHSRMVSPVREEICKEGDPGCQKTCLSARELLVMFNLGADSQIDTMEFLQLCPVLMYQLDARTCWVGGPRQPTGSRGTTSHTTHGHGSEGRVEGVAGKSIPGKVWGFSLLAVIIISAVGLVSVAIIPIINKVFYNHLLQFLVAMAVGALSGDALLHLLPHAMELGAEPGGHAAHGEDAHGHNALSVWIGLMALAGIYSFFVLERVVTIITVVKNKKKRQKKRSSPVYLGKEAQFSPAVGAKLSGHVENCEEMVMVVHPNKAIKEFANGTQASLHECNEEHDHSEKDNFEEAMESLTAGTVVVESGHSHGHGHGHSHEIPNSVAAVAWMVILGDGIHNFTDGLAIGAAFSSSVTGGISTSIAIFCHELPHEIGDFAVLLRTGMSIKQALVYNCVSSILCLIGMVIGVPLGNLENASMWIFAMVGGMFIYIAFVDMLPEMTSVDTKQGEHPFCHLIFQVFGMLVGAGIMLLIAVYEHDIKASLDHV